MSIKSKLLAVINRLLGLLHLRMNTLQDYKLLEDQISFYKLYKQKLEAYERDLNCVVHLAIPIDERLDFRFPPLPHRVYPEDPSKAAQILNFSVLTPDGKPCAVLEFGWPIIAEAEFVVRQPGIEMDLSFMIHDAWVKYVSATHTVMVPDMPSRWNPGRYRVRMEFPSGIINVGRYALRVGLGWIDNTIYDFHDDGIRFKIIAMEEIKPHSIHSHGLLAVIPRFSLVEQRLDQARVSTI